MSNGLMITLCVLFAVSTACSIARIILQNKDRKNGGRNKD